MTGGDRPELRRVTEDEWEDFTRYWVRVFHHVPRDEIIRHRREHAHPSRFLTATDDGGHYVASAGAYEFDLSLPGGSRIDCAGVSAVTVRTDHRRRGLLRAMMTQLHRDAAEHADPVAALWATEAPIYGRFGYGAAVPGTHFSIRQSQLRGLAGGDASRVRELARDDYLAAGPAVHEQVRDGRPGMLARSASWWLAGTEDEEAAEKRPLRYAAVGDRGVVRFMVHEGTWDHDVPAATVTVKDLLAVDAEAEADLWAYVASIDLVTTVEAEVRPVDDPLPWRILDRVQLRRRAAPPLFVRLLDVPTALEARSYDATDRLVLEVHDDQHADNDRRWSLEAGPEGAEVTPTDDAADVELSVTDLASLWLGGYSPLTLEAAGRIDIASHDRARRLHRIFATDRAPWCPLDF